MKPIHGSSYEQFVRQLSQRKLIYIHSSPEVFVNTFRFLILALSFSSLVACERGSAPENRDSAPQGLNSNGMAPEAGAEIGAAKSADKEAAAQGAPIATQSAKESAGQASAAVSPTPASKSE